MNNINCNPNPHEAWPWGSKSQGMLFHTCIFILALCFWLDVFFTEDIPLRYLALWRGRGKFPPPLFFKKRYWFSFSCFIERLHLFIFREGNGKEKERERNISVWLPLTHLLLGTWPATQACALDWESNPWPFGSQASTQSTEPHQPGPM